MMKILSSSLLSLLTCTSLIVAYTLYGSQPAPTPLRGGRVTIFGGQLEKIEIFLEVSKKSIRNLAG